MGANSVFTPQHFVLFLALFIIAFNDVLAQKDKNMIYTSKAKNDTILPKITYLKEKDSVAIKQSAKGLVNFTFANNDQYEGYWSKGKMNGQGVFIKNNGDIYIGHFKEGIKAGKGVYVYFFKDVLDYGVKSKNNSKIIKTNGAVYKGDFMNDVRHGKGTIQYSNGDSYEGDWKNDNKEGQGKYIWADGFEFVGQWKNDNRIAGPQEECDVIQVPSVICADGLKCQLFANGSVCSKECPKGIVCKVLTKIKTKRSQYSYVARQFEQCDGQGFNPLDCPRNFQCFERNEWFSQCRPYCPTNWDCDTGSRSSSKTPQRYSSVYLAPSDIEVTGVWAKFIQKNNKKYATQKETNQRFAIFEKNYDQILQHNEDADAGKYSYYLALNPFSDMSDNEFYDSYIGKPTPAPVQASKNPSSIDWRNKNVVSSVGDQRYCRSDWAFAVIGSIESQIAIKTGNLVALSVQQLLDCENSVRYVCRDGNTLKAGFEYMKNNGAPSAKNYPYQDQKGSCPSSHGRSRNDMITIEGYTKIARDEKTLEETVANKGPVATTIMYDADFATNVSPYEIIDNCRTEKAKSHAVLIVGYGESNGRKYWLVKNSWGTNWRDGGYVRIAKDNDNTCDIGLEAYIPIIKDNNNNNNGNTGQSHRVQSIQSVQSVQSVKSVHSIQTVQAVVHVVPAIPNPCSSIRCSSPNICAVAPSSCASSSRCSIATTCKVSVVTSPCSVAPTPCTPQRSPCAVTPSRCNSNDGNAKCFEITNKSEGGCTTTTRYCYDYKHIKCYTQCRTGAVRYHCGLDYPGVVSCGYPGYFYSGSSCVFPSEWRN